MTQETIRIFNEPQPARQRRSSFLSLEHDGRLYAFHLERVRDRMIRPAQSVSVSRKGGHAHPVFHLLLFTDGRGSLFYDGVTECSRGDLLCISPSEFHRIAFHTTSRVRFIALTFCLQSKDGTPYTADLATYLKELTGAPVVLPSSQPIHLPATVYEDMKVQLELLLDLLLASDRHDNRSRADLQILAFLVELATYLQAGSNAATPVDPRYLRVRAHIRRHAHEPLTIETLAQRVGVSSSHFQRRFREIFAVTPIAYQQQLRIESAQRMLRDTDWALAEIAERIGYQNVYYFSTIFKKVVGIAPGRFRRQSRLQDDQG